jgi:hypothetical protein
LAVTTGFPTLLAAAGDTNVNDRLLQGWKIGDRTYRVHIDGYNQLPYLTGQEDHSARRGFIYFDDDGQLVAIRFDNWKLVFFEQKTPGTLDIWGEPFTARRLPLFFNLRMDPYERAQITSNEYYAWTLHKGYLMFGAQAIAAAFVNSLKGLSAATEATELQSRSDHGATAKARGERLRETAPVGRECRPAHSISAIGPSRPIAFWWPTVAFGA